MKVLIRCDDSSLADVLQWVDGKKSLYEDNNAPTRVVGYTDDTGNLSFDVTTHHGEYTHASWRISNNPERYQHIIVFWFEDTLPRPSTTELLEVESLGGTVEIL